LRELYLGFRENLVIGSSQVGRGISYLLHVGRGGACGLVCWPSVLGFEGGAARRDGAFQSWSHCRVWETFELNQLKSAPSQRLPVFSRI
jgi:hypothetical protein